MKKGYTLLLAVLLFISAFMLTVFTQFIADKGGINNKLLFDSKLLKSDQYSGTNKNVVFLGDSIIKGGAWSEYFPDLSIQNQGVNGDRTESILNRLDPIVQGRPCKIFLLAGINDLAANLEYEKILENYRNIILTIQLETPETKIYAGSILPVNRKNLQDIPEKKNNIVIPIMNRKVREMNTLLKELCNKTRVTYIDYYPYFAEAQELKAELTTDGLHLNPDGYSILSKVIKPYLR